MRDVLHIADLTELIDMQLREFAKLDGQVFNVGGGLKCSLSLREMTDLCRQIVGRTIPTRSVAESRCGDVRVYVSDNAAVTTATGWAPRRHPTDVLADTHSWVVANEPVLRSLARESG